MAKQVQLILDDDVITSYRALCKARGKSVQKVLEEFIKEELKGGDKSTSVNGSRERAFRPDPKPSGRQPLVG